MEGKFLGIFLVIPIKEENKSIFQFNPIYSIMNSTGSTIPTLDMGFCHQKN